MPQVVWKIEPGEKWSCVSCSEVGYADSHGNLTHRCVHPQIISSGELWVNPPNKAKRDLTRPRYDLIPKEWLDCLAAIFEEGAKRYDDHNWKRGGEEYARDCRNHAMDHLLRANAGDTSELHLGKVAWNALAAYWLSKNPSTKETT